MVCPVNLGQSKNGAGRTFPIDAMPSYATCWGARSWPRWFEAHGRRPRFVFCHDHGSQVKAFDKAWRSARKRADSDRIHERQLAHQQYGTSQANSNHRPRLPLNFHSRNGHVEIRVVEGRAAAAELASAMTVN